MTEDEVFAEFYFTTIVVPVWRHFTDYLEISEALNAYQALPGSKPNRLSKFIEEHVWEHMRVTGRAIREGRNLYDRRRSVR